MDDVVVGVSGEAIQAADGAGAISVFYGSASSADRFSVGSQVFWQGNGGMQGAAEQDDHLGDVLVAADLNGDQCDDLLMGVPLEDIGATLDAGAVNVLFGSAGGLTGVDDILLTASVTPNGVTPLGNFGFSLGVVQEPGQAARILVSEPGASGPQLPNSGAVHAFTYQPSPAPALVYQATGYGLAEESLGSGVMAIIEHPTGAAGLEVLVGSMTGSAPTVTLLHNDLSRISTFSTNSTSGTPVSAIAAGPWDRQPRNGWAYRGDSALDQFVRAEFWRGNSARSLELRQDAIGESVSGTEFGKALLLEVDDLRDELSLWVGDPSAGLGGRVYRIRDAWLFSDGFESGDLSAWAP